MPDTTHGRRSNCPISFTLDAFGDKWTLLVLRDIMFYDRTRFSDFMPVERIATNILADRLGKLEAAGMITKERGANLKNQFIYSVTPKGKSLLPLLIEMTLWGLEHDPESLASKEFVERARNGLQLLARTGQAHAAHVREADVHQLVQRVLGRARGRATW